MIRIAIVDDHPLILQALTSNFELEDDIEVVGTFRDGKGLLSHLMELSPDVLLLDLKVPNLNPLALVTELRTMLPEMRVAVITAANQPGLLQQLLDAGVTGIQIKSEPKDPAEIVRAVHGGSLYLSAEAMQLTRRAESSYPELSERDVTLLDHLIEGHTNDEISTAMILTNGTVGNYISQLYRKLGVPNRARAVSWWAQNRGHYQPQ